MLTRKVFRGHHQRKCIDLCLRGTSAIGRRLRRHEVGCSSQYEGDRGYEGQTSIPGHLSSPCRARSKRWTGLNASTARAALALYDVAEDPGETTNVAAGNPEVVRRLTMLAEKAREDLGDVDIPGKGQRPVGRFENPAARVIARQP